mgnify:CR=1 FL=1
MKTTKKINIFLVNFGKGVKMSTQSEQAKLVRKVFQTNSALGYNQTAYLIEAEGGYLVIDTHNIHFDDEKYFVGGIVNLDKNEIENSNYSINMSPLKGTFLFEYFLKYFKEID